MKLNGEQFCFYMGQYPDVNGLKRDLIIREGKVGVWRDSGIEKGALTDECYYEVVVNRKVLALVAEAYTKNHQPELAF